MQSDIVPEKNPFKNLLATIEVAGKTKHYFDITTFGDKYGKS